MAKILLVDDDENVRFALEKILLKNGFDVMSAINGIEAMQLFRDQIFDLVLLDIFMPEKDGYETMMEMDRLPKQVPIIAMSAYTQHHMQALRNAQVMGAKDILTKPFSEDDLLGAMRKVLH